MPENQKGKIKQKKAKIGGYGENGLGSCVAVPKHTMQQRKVERGGGQM